MAVLSDAERRKLWAEFMDGQSAARAQMGTLTKAELRAAVDAVDEWVDQNAVSYNAALPEPARQQLSARQKVAILAAVVRRRTEVQHG